MKATRARRILELAVPVVFILACNSINSIVATPTSTATSTPPAPTETPTITLAPLPSITPTPFYDVKTGNMIAIPSGGFKFASIVNYTLEKDNGGAFLQSKDKDVVVVLSAWPPFPGISRMRIVLDALEELGEQYEEFNASEPVQGKDGAVETIHVEFTGLEKDKPVHGSILLQSPPDSKYLYFFLIARGDQRWEREGQKVFDQIADSIEFFPLTARSDCPINNNPDYGTRTDRPIRIGGGLANGIQRTHDYLDALLSLDNEPIYYYRVGSVTEGGETLDKYQLLWGKNTSLTLFFDIYHYEELHIHRNLTCSALPPSAPR